MPITIVRSGDDYENNKPRISSEINFSNSNSFLVSSDKWRQNIEKVVRLTLNIDEK